MTVVLAQSDWPIPVDDPYPTLARLRAQRHVHFLPDLVSYLVVANHEANMILTGTGWSADPRSNPATRERLAGSAANEFSSKSVLFSDPPGHHRLRRALSGHLTPAAVEGFRPRIRSIVESAFVGCDTLSFELMDRIAYPVPLAVICEILDVPPSTAEVLRSDTRKVVDILDPLAGPEAFDASATAAFGIMLELIPLVADRRSDPGDDLLSSLVSGSADQPGLQTDEAIMMALLLLAAGHETTANLIGNVVACLHSHPDHVRWLRTHPSAIGTAIEEVLRFESPVQLTSRVATDDVKLDGLDLAAGTRVFVSIGGANRDPSIFVDPDRFDLQRASPRHLSFGHGAHFCAGASLARAEAQEVLSFLLSLDPPLEDREVRVQRGESHTFRRIQRLEIVSA